MTSKQACPHDTQGFCPDCYNESIRNAAAKFLTLEKLPKRIGKILKEDNAAKRAYSFNYEDEQDFVDRYYRNLRSKENRNGQDNNS